MATYNIVPGLEFTIAEKFCTNIYGSFTAGKKYRAVGVFENNGITAPLFIDDKLMIRHVPLTTNDAIQILSCVTDIDQYFTFPPMQALLQVQPPEVATLTNPSLPKVKFAETSENDPNPSVKVNFPGRVFDSGGFNKHPSEFTDEEIAAMDKRSKPYKEWKEWKEAQDGSVS